MSSWPYLAMPGGVLNGDIGPYPWPDPEPLATPDWYVDSAATGAANGSSWTDAYTTIQAAITAAADGDVIEVSGGTTGKTYTQDLSAYKASVAVVVTIQGSKATGHSGLVKTAGRMYAERATLILKNFQHTCEIDGKVPYRINASCEFHCYDMIMGPFRTQSTPSILGGVVSFNKCKFARVYRTDTATTPFFLNSSGIATISFNNCILDRAGNASAVVSGTTLNVDKCLVLSTGGDATSATFNAGNSATTSVNITDSAFFGCYPLTTGASSKAPVVTNVFWTKQPGVTGISGNILTFDSSNKSTLTNTITNVLPYFTQPKNGSIGDFFVRYDDRNELDVSTVTAATLNPEVVITHAVNLHSRFTATRPSATEIDYMRELLAADNDIISHAASHSDGGTLNCINISATGTSPTVSISGTRTGDSSTWTATLTITVNAVDAAFNLTNSSYDQIGLLVTAINGLSVGDGTVTASKSVNNHSIYLFSAVLADVTAQSISSTYNLQLSDAAFIRFEDTEAILDLETYINSGTDRNSANAVTGMTETAPSPAYVCRGWASPYGTGRASRVTALSNNTNILIANKATSGGGEDAVSLYGKDINMYNFSYLTIVADTQSEDNFSLAVSAAAGGGVFSPLWHGGTPAFNGSLANFKAMLQHFGLGARTMADWAAEIRANTDFTVTEPNIAFTGDAADYVLQGDYTLLSNSPLKGQGSPP